MHKTDPHDPVLGVVHAVELLHERERVEVTVPDPDPTCLVERSDDRAGRERTFAANEESYSRGPGRVVEGRADDAHATRFLCRRGEEAQEDVEEGVLLRRHGGAGGRERALGRERLQVGDDGGAGVRHLVAGSGDAADFVGVRRIRGSGGGEEVVCDGRARVHEGGGADVHRRDVRAVHLEKMNMGLESDVCA
jgi:hypothetical protein